MNSSARQAVSTAVFVALGFASIAAQGPQAKGQRMYDPATETTLTGTVAAVETVTRPEQAGRRGLGGLHLTLKTSSESIAVHLGPTAYMNEQKVVIAEGDILEIVGSRVTMDGEPVLLARTVKKGANTWTLRDASGKPLWSGPPR